MIFQDMNRSWTPPDGYECTGVVADGAYLKIEFSRGDDLIAVFLNDMGREVGRAWYEKPAPTINISSPAPKVQPLLLTHWARFKNGFFMILIGIEEMLKCLKN